MAIDTRRARHALKAAGVRGLSLLPATWPFAHGPRLPEVLRRRLAVVETMNAVCDLLFPLQRAITMHRVDSLSRVRELLADPDQRRHLLGATQTRTVIAEELSRSVGMEVGSTLDVALAELVAARVLLRIPGREVLAQEDVFLLRPCHRCPRLPTAELKRLLREDGAQAQQLRLRERRRSTTDGSRSYDL